MALPLPTGRKGPLCPRCHRAPVAVSLSAWTQGGVPRRSAWLDEPAVCALGCRLSSEEVRRLLVAVLRTHPAQLRLPHEEVAE